jgi:hypothetical protein
MDGFDPSRLPQRPQNGMGGVGPGIPDMRGGFNPQGLPQLPQNAMGGGNPANLGLRGF